MTEDGRSQQHILIIEDKDNIRNLLSINLRARGYETQTAGSAEEALDILANERPSLMLLDISLPGMTGWDFLRAIEDNEDIKQLPVVVITGTPPTSKETRQHPNVIDVIIKPVRIEHFISTVRRALNT